MYESYSFLMNSPQKTVTQQHNGESIDRKYVYTGNTLITLIKEWNEQM